MSNMHTKRVPQRRRLLPAILFACTALIATSASAGDIKIGQDKELAVTEGGSLTSEGRSAAVTELDNVPGEDLWIAYLWAQIDRGVEGPLYVEFFQNVGGQTSIVHRHEQANYDGGKYLSVEIELGGNFGFNKGRTYTIKVLQSNAKGKDIILAKSKIKLVKSGRKPAESEDGGGRKDEKEEYSDQDRADSLAGPDEEDQTEAPDKEPETNEEAPPPVEPKKGCSVSAEESTGFSGPLVLLLAAAGLTFRRRKRA